MLTSWTVVLRTLTDLNNPKFSLKADPELAEALDSSSAHPVTVSLKQVSQRCCGRELSLIIKTKWYDLHTV